MMLKKLLPAAAVLLALTACAQLQPGATRDEAIAHYGKPTAEFALPTGSRLQFSGQPLNQANYMVDLDPAGRVVSVNQALTAKNFERVVPGQWTRQDALREFGKPASVDRVASWNGDILTYRWLLNYEPMFFWIYLDPQNVVGKVGQGMEFPMRPNDQ